MRTTVTALIISIALVTVSASANVMEVSDPRDMPEDAIDIANAEHGHERHEVNVAPFRHQRLLRHRLTMHEEWTYREPAQIRIGLWFNVDSDAQVERELRLHIEDPDAPYAEMTDQRGRVRGFAKLSRPNQHSIQFVFPKVLLKKRLTRYRWRAWATSEFTPPPECRPPNPPCPMPLPLDHAPDQGWIRHEL